MKATIKNIKTQLNKLGIQTDDSMLIDEAEKLIILNGFEIQNGLLIKRKSEGETEEEKEIREREEAEREENERLRKEKKEQEEKERIEKEQKEKEQKEQEEKERIEKERIEKEKQNESSQNKDKLDGLLNKIKASEEHNNKDEGKQNPSSKKTTKSKTKEGIIIKGFILLMIIDSIFPYSIAFINNLLDKKLQINGSDLQLEDEQLTKLEPLADEAAEYLQVKMNPALAFFLVSSFMYGSKLMELRTIKAAN